MPATLAALLSWTVAITTITISWPQIWLSCVHRRTSGLSAAAATLGPALNLSWLSYGLLIGDPLQVIVNAAVGVGSVAVLAALVLLRPELFRGSALGKVVALPVLLLVGVVTALTATGAGLVDAAVAGPTLGLAATAFGAMSVLPQPIALLRDRAQDMSGVSAGRFVLSTASASLWFVHGITGAQVAVVASSSLVLVSSLVVLGCVRVNRRIRQTVLLPTTPVRALVAA